MVRTLRTCNQTIRFLKFIFNKNIEKKFEGFFFFKLVWKETSFHREREVLGFIKFKKKKKRGGGGIPQPIRERRSVTIPFQPI